MRRPARARAQALILAAHARKQAEQAEFAAALAAALAERDAEGRALIAAYDQSHKRLLRDSAAEEQVRRRRRWPRTRAPQAWWGLTPACSPGAWPPPHTPRA